MKTIIDELQHEVSYGCQQSVSDRFMHNVCQMSSMRSKACLHIVGIDRDKAVESYVEMMGLTALEWIETYDYEYKTGIWMESEGWKKERFKPHSFLVPFSLNVISII